jgi:hypothetical protein
LNDRAERDDYCHETHRPIPIVGENGAADPVKQLTIFDDLSMLDSRRLSSGIWLIAPARLTYAALGNSAGQGAGPPCSPASAKGPPHRAEEHDTE